jgi:hypothetical protein
MPWMLAEDHSVIEVDAATFEAWFMRTRADHSLVVVAKSGDEFIEVSTIFLVLYPPELGFFETLVMGGPLDGYDSRYMTWDEAVEGHKAMVERVTLACIQEGTFIGGSKDAEEYPRAIPYKEAPQIEATGLEEESPR